MFICLELQCDKVNCTYGDYTVLCSMLLHFWLVEELAELADSVIGCGEMARGECLLAWNFSVTR